PGAKIPHHQSVPGQARHRPATGDEKGGVIHAPNRVALKATLLDNIPSFLSFRPLGESKREVFGDEPYEPESSGNGRSTHCQTYISALLIRLRSSSCVGQAAAHPVRRSLGEGGWMPAFAGMTNTLAVE